MSKYTTSIETIIYSQTSYLKTDNVFERIEEGRKFLFDFDYPIINEDFKKNFETQFIEKFWQECIGYETVPLFKLKLKQRLEMLMPEYNYKYNFMQEMLKQENPNLERYGESYEKTEGQTDAHSHNTNTASSSVSGESESESASNQKTVSSDLPASVIKATDIGDISHADGGSIAEGSQSTSGSNSSSGSSNSQGNSESNSVYHNTVERNFKEYGSMLKAFDFLFNMYQNLMRNLLNEFDDMFIQLLY